jgi:hypothetical protein
MFEETLRMSFIRAGRIKCEDPRRKQERADFNMINEDKTAMANLPRMAQHHEFPPLGGYFLPEWD